MANRGTDHRLRVGIHPVVDVTSTYELSAIAVPSGDMAHADWYVIAGEGSTPPQPARISTNADGSKSDDGFYTFAWRISYLSFAMLDNFLTAVGLETARSADVTVMTYNEINEAVFVQCKIHRPLLPGPDAQHAPDGYQNIIFRFTNGVIIT